MKIIHTSDWHLGHVLYAYDRSEEQRDMLRQIAELCTSEQPDALLVSGDVFHNAAPSAASQQMLVNGLLAMHAACPNCRIIVTAGNHDSAARLEATAQLWQLAGITVIGHAMRNSDGLPDLDRHIVELPGCGWVVAVPHVYPTNFPAPPEVPREQRMTHFLQAALDRVAERNTAQLPVVLMAHLAVDGGDFTGHDNIGTIDTVPIAALGTGYDYAALGHIHRPQTLDTDGEGRVRYCGTPLPVSFDEQCEHSVSIVTLDGHNTPHIATHHITNLHPLHTIPPSEPVTLEQAIEELERFPSTEPAYIRLNVAVDGYVPTDARERAASAVADKQCRFCTLKVTSTATATNEQPQLTVEQLQQLSPLDVARIYINRKTHHPMTDEQEQMLQQAISSVQQEGGDA
ncbi:MAG: exonuclease SbcCD subunit D [Muribaculaceae bacterium]|nr:exonuclease SbcCD subunit D [Muribaculaceae bacterium]